MKKSRIEALARGLTAIALPLTLSLAATAVQAQSQVRLMVGYAAGGPVDASARQFAPALAKELGMQVIVENKPGVAGALAGAEVAKSRPDGMTLYYSASPTLTITPHVIKTMPFDPTRDLTPIAPVLSYANLLVVNKDQPFKTVQELVAFARANPSKVSYGSAGMGASNHLSGELFAQRAGIQLMHVPYKGNAPAMTDVIGGQLTMMFDIVSTARQYVSSGRVRPLAVTSRERNPSMPDVPTMREAGIADYDVAGWYGVYGPAKMAPELVEKINRATRAALNTADMKQKLSEAGYDLWTGTPQLLAERQARELALWGTVTKGIKFD